jgi:hypothetical protein
MGENSPNLVTLPGSSTKANNPTTSRSTGRGPKNWREADFFRAKFCVKFLFSIFVDNAFSQTIKIQSLLHNSLTTFSILQTDTFLFLPDAKNPDYFWLFV